MAIMMGILQYGKVYYLCIMALHVLAVIMFVESKKQKELEIVTQFKPDDCYEHADFGDEVHVHYTGSLENGQVFDSSRQEGRGPLPFQLGQGRVIPGWEQGIRGMCVGERRILTIPPHLGYGSKGVPPTIPPDATLVFETELVSIEKGGSGGSAGSVDILGLLQMLAVPAFICYVIYYLYDKYRSAPTKRELKEEKKSMRNSHRKKHK